MTDVLYVALVVAFFALCVGYVRACDRIVAGHAEDAPTTPGADRRPAEPRP